MANDQSFAEKYVYMKMALKKAKKNEQLARDIRWDFDTDFEEVQRRAHTQAMEYVWGEIGEWLEGRLVTNALMTEHHLTQEQQERAEGIDQGRSDSPFGSKRFCEGAAYALRISIATLKSRDTPLKKPLPPTPLEMHLRAIRAYIDETLEDTDQRQRASPFLEPILKQIRTALGEEDQGSGTADAAH